MRLTHGWVRPGGGSELESDCHGRSRASSVKQETHSTESVQAKDWLGADIAREGAGCTKVPDSLTLIFSLNQLTSWFQNYWFRIVDS